MPYKLTYFAARGRAELSRMIFAQAAVAYEDVRIDGAQWAQLKPSESNSSSLWLSFHATPLALRAMGHRDTCWFSLTCQFQADNLITYFIFLYVTL